MGESATTPVCSGFARNIGISIAAAEQSPRMTNSEKEASFFMRRSLAQRRTAVRDVDASGWILGTAPRRFRCNWDVITADREKKSPLITGINSLRVDFSRKR